ncbi:four-carbon acid sugar kinase family protein [Rhizobium laguerreae]|uniref:four-carbon acid sugar kinase family protein n=1 Tax=Rhizobium laguerreae TaxID=1076926 RepID=UPI001C9121E9|nr:four-carbon acid sugar kinase family protein [Rhizobium laguerreae]MBY3163926.1 four-carbon acid sugar kinase family protein [Rhizobium laguerreae]
MTTLRLIADDLTGALDSAAQFTGSLGSLPVLTSVAVAAVPGSFVLNLSCRDGAETAAIERARAARTAFVGADIAFKKIDSLLRGHWAPELAATLETGLFDRVVLAPAFPAQGRFTHGGEQFMRDRDGATKSVGRPGDILGAVMSGGHHASDVDILVPDVSADADLHAAVDIYRSTARTLWCGAAGLAQAIAATPAQRIETGSARHLVLIGSYHEATKRQMNRFVQETSMDSVRFGADGEAGAKRIMADLDAQGACVAVPDLPDAISPSEAAILIARSIEGLSRALPPPQRLTIVGGETFASLCNHLNASVLSVEGECEPGVPASRITTGRWEGTLCFSKSGAFGDPDWLVRQTALARQTYQHSVMTKDR